MITKKINKLLGTLGAALVLVNPSFGEDNVLKNGWLSKPYLTIQTGKTSEGDFNNRLFFGADIFDTVSLSGFYSANNFNNNDSFGIYDMSLKTNSSFSPFIRVASVDGKYDETYMAGRYDLEKLLPNTNCSFRVLLNDFNKGISENFCTVNFDKFNLTSIYSATLEKSEKPNHYVETELDVPFGKNTSFYLRGENLVHKDKKGVLGLSYTF